MNIHELPKEDFIDCLYDLFHRDEKENYSSFEDMLYGKFGKSITEKFLKPYNEKLYACNLNELDTDAMGRFFPYANPEQIIDNMKKSSVQTYNSTFDYPKQGAQFFINILLERIDRNKILLNSYVKSIDIVNKIAAINGEEYRFEKLINTIPLNQFIKLLPTDYTSIDDGTLSCNKVLVFNLGFDKEPIDKNVHWTYIPMKSVNFYRCGFYNNILGDERLSMYIEIGYKENDCIDVDKQLNLTLENLRDLGIITDHKLISYNSLIINPGYVHITDASNKKVKELREKLGAKQIYTIGRYGKWTYCSIEDCMVDAIGLAMKKNE
jgi:protoporphyrinogen oxidase